MSRYHWCVGESLSLKSKTWEKRYRSKEKHGFSSKLDVGAMDFSTIYILHVSTAEPKILGTPPQWRSLRTPQHRQMRAKTGRERQWKLRGRGRRGRRVREKRSDKLIKKESQRSRAVARMKSSETLDFIIWSLTRRWDPHQPVSGGFTAMTLRWKPLCCLGCKLRVHTESWALTLKWSKTLIPPMFFPHQTALWIRLTKA